MKALKTLLAALLLSLPLPAAVLDISGLIQTTADGDKPITVTGASAGAILFTNQTKANVLEAALFAADAGASDTYVATLSPAITVYVTGAHYRFKANTTNTGAATINFNGLGAKQIVRVAPGTFTALFDGDILAGQWVDLVFDGTFMQMQSLVAGTAAFLGTANVFTQPQTIPTIIVNPVVGATAPTVALVAVAGNVNNGTHAYRVSYVTLVGETELSVLSNVVTTDGSHGQVTVTIPVSIDSRVTSRKIYRTPAGGSTVGDVSPTYLLATVANNSATSYVDNIADASLGALNYSIHDNTTGGQIYSNNVLTVTLGKRWDAALGYGALSNNTSGGGNSALGASALLQNTSGSFNQAIGYLALSDNTSGSYNSAMGDSALTHNLTGVGSVGIGWQSLVNKTAASYNTAIGYGTMQGSGGTGTQENTTVGSQSMSKTTTGIQNTATGAQALFENLTGGDNVADGFAALQNATGSYNVGIGEFAGRNTTGSNNTFLGNSAGYTGTATDGSVFIGDRAGFFETGDNKLFIDNTPRANEADARANALVYGVFDSGNSAAQIFAVKGNMGVNTNAPASHLYGVPGVAIYGTANAALSIGNANKDWVTYVSGSDMTIAELPSGGGGAVFKSGGALQVNGSLAIAGGTPIIKVLSAAATLDFGSTLAGAVSDLTITVTGAALGDVVALGIPNASMPASGTYQGWVSATNTVTVRYENNDLLTARDPASGSFRAMVTQF